MASNQLGEEIQEFVQNKARLMSAIEESWEQGAALFRKTRGSRAMRFTAACMTQPS